MLEYGKLDVVGSLPPAERFGEQAQELFAAMRGALIIAIGAPRVDWPQIEGGGLIIDFVPNGASTPRRAVFAFNENGMWVLYDGPITATP